MGDELACKRHPCAPHGFDRNGSHSADRYVCECEGWQPDQSCAADKLRATIEDMKARMMRLDARVLEGEREANEIAGAGRRVVAAFEALGKSDATGDRAARAECEKALVALNRALAGGAGR